MELEEAVRPCWIEIDLAALAHNVGLLRTRLGPDKHIIAALKGGRPAHLVTVQRLAGPFRPTAMGRKAGRLARDGSHHDRPGTL